MKRYLVAIVIVVVLAATIVWRFATKASAAQAMSANVRTQLVRNVRVGKAGPHVIRNTVEVVGSIDTPFNVRLSPTVAGAITFLNAREGDVVKKGQTLVMIDPSAAQSALDAAIANQATNWQRYVQAKYTQNPNDVSVTAGIEQQKAAVEAGKADYGQIVNNEKAQIQAAEQVVVDNENKVRSAKSNVETMQANLVSAQANYNDAKVKDQRYETLYKQGFIAAQDLDDQRATAEVGKANVGVATANLHAAQAALTSAEAELSGAIKQKEVVALQAQSNIAASKKNLDQSIASLKLAMANRGNIPSYIANLEALKKTYDASVSQVAQARANLGYTTIKSPIDGVVTARTADPGNIAQPGTPVLTVQLLSWVYLTSQVPVEYYGDIHAGQDIKFTVDAIPNRTFDAKIDIINNSADPLSRQFLIRAKVANNDVALRPGMFARLKMTTMVVHAEVAVPREAVTTGPNNYYAVTLAVPGTGKNAGKTVAHIVPVTIGLSDAWGYEILTGVHPGDTIVTQTYSALREGQPIRVAAPGEKLGPATASSGGAGTGGAAGQGAPNTDATGSTSGSASGVNKGSGESMGSVGPSGAGSSAATTTGTTAATGGPTMNAGGASTNPSPTVGSSTTAGPTGAASGGYGGGNPGSAAPSDGNAGSPSASGATGGAAGAGAGTGGAAGGGGAGGAGGAGGGGGK